MEIKAQLNKPYTDKQRIDFIIENNHKNGYTIEETDNALLAWGADDDELLEQARGKCVEKNDKLRDKALLSGVTYNNVLFDSDTDQKVNLLATVSTMTETDTILWYGMDNQGLLCTKADLMAIGGLITELHSFCWNMNAHIKEQIESAETIEQLEEIEINYSKKESEDNNV